MTQPSRPCQVEFFIDYLESNHAVQGPGKRLLFFVFFWLIMGGRLKQWFRIRESPPKMREAFRAKNYRKMLPSLDDLSPWRWFAWKENEGSESSIHMMKISRKNFTNLGSCLDDSFIILFSLPVKPWCHHGEWVGLPYMTSVCHHDKWVM